jgi:Trk K+ transport system NAD-binding subunit
VRANLHDIGQLLSESRLVLVAFALVTLSSTLYLLLRYADDEAPESFGEALYETLKLLTLQSGLAYPGGDLLGTVIFFLTPILGLALIVQSVLNFGRLVLDKGSRREEWQVSLASTYRDHVIVCGLGRLGLRVVTQLVAAGYEPVVIERDWNSEFVRRTLSFKVPVVLGDAREADVLRQAGVMRARAVIATVNDDLINIEIALNARAMNPSTRPILRIFGEELDRNLERELEPNTAFSTSAIAAPTFAAAAASREIDYVMPLPGAPLGVAELVAQENSYLVGNIQAIEQQEGIRVLHHKPTPGSSGTRKQVRAVGIGDAVTVIGTLAAIEALRVRSAADSRASAMASAPVQRLPQSHHTIIVCGLGKVGYRVVQQLWQLQPRPKIVVVRLDDGRDEFPKKIEQLDGVTTICGDAQDLQVLLEAGLDNAYSVAALTSDDLVNLQIGLTVRSRRPDMHIVLRTFSDALAERLGGMVRVRTAYSTSALAAPTLAAAAVLGNIQHAFFAGGQLYSSDRLTIDERHPFAECSVQEIRDTYGVLVVGLQRGARLSPVPPLDVGIMPGDELSVLGTLVALGRVRELRPGAPRATTRRLRR